MSVDLTLGVGEVCTHILKSVSLRLDPGESVAVLGPSGSGKTTIATALSDRLGWTYAEADEFHSPANIERMTQGIPLTDEDRWPWLRIHAQALHEAADATKTIWKNQSEAAAYFPEKSPDQNLKLILESNP